MNILSLDKRLDILRFVERTEGNTHYTFIDETVL